MKITLALKALILASPALLMGCSGSGFDLDRLFTGARTQPAEEAPHARGVHHFSEGHFGLAAKYFREATEQDPHSIESLNGLAASYDRLGRFDLSERIYRRALARNPTSSQTLNNLGYSYLLQGKFDLALVYLRDADSLAAGNEIIQSNRQAAEAAAGMPPSAAPARGEEGEPALERRAIPAVWVERSTPAVQTLITRPSPEFMIAARESGVDPRLTSHHGGLLENAVYIPDPIISPEPPQRAMVQSASYEPSADAAEAALDVLKTAAPTGEAAPLIEVSNGAGRLGMAARLKTFLERKGLTVGRLTNAESYNNHETTIFYRQGWSDFARRLAALLPAEIRFAVAPEGRSDIRVRLGGDLLDFDGRLISGEVADDQAG